MAATSGSRKWDDGRGRAYQLTLAERKEGELAQVPQPKRGFYV